MSFIFSKPDQPQPRDFKSICHEMHEVFGGAWANVRAVVTTEPERQLIKAQMAELKLKVRELLEQTKELKEDNDDE